MKKKSGMVRIDFILDSLKIGSGFGSAVIDHHAIGLAQVQSDPDSNVPERLYGYKNQKEKLKQLLLPPLLLLL